MFLEAENKAWSQEESWKALVERGDDLIILGKVLGRVTNFE